MTSPSQSTSPTVMAWRNARVSNSPRSHVISSRFASDTGDHLGRAAVVYIRQSTLAQVVGNLESQRRQYALVDAAKAAGFASISVIDDDLGRSGSGLTVRPGFQKLVALVCAGSVGAVYC